MNFKSLTENRYTLNDIFVKQSEIWLTVALLMYPLAHIVHIIVFSILFRGFSMSFEENIHYLNTHELPGDYLVELVDTFFILALVIGTIALVSEVKTETNKKRIKNNKAPHIFFAAFIMLAIISVLINGISKELFFGYTERGEGFVAFLIYFFLFFLGSMIKKENFKYTIIYSIMLLGFALGTMTLINEFICEVPIVNYRLYAAVYYNTNFYAYFLTILIMLSAGLVLKDKSKGRKLFAFISLCINTVVLAMNNTFGCFVACLVAFIIMIIADSVIKKEFSFAALGLFSVFLIICFVCGLWYPSFYMQILGLFTDIQMIVTENENAADAGTLRWGLWVQTVKYIREKPWIGFGFEGVCERLMNEAGQGKVHNEYLEYAADFGVPAALCYIRGLIAIYIKALKKRAQIDGATFCALVAAFGYIGSAFFGNSKVFIAPFFFIVLGLANAIGEEEPAPESVCEKLQAEEEESPVISSEVEKSEILRLTSFAQDDTVCHSEPAEESDDTSCHSELVEESDADEVEETELAEESIPNNAEETERFFDSLTLAQDDKSTTVTQDNSNVTPSNIEESPVISSEVEKSEQ